MGWWGGTGDKTWQVIGGYMRVSVDGKTRDEKRYGEKRREKQSQGTVFRCVGC